MESRFYYEAYDDRYRQIHAQNLRWFSDEASSIVQEVLRRYGIGSENRILEIGCGEGRDAQFLLDRGYDLLATDISPAAIAFCRRENPLRQERFQTLDCLTQSLPERFDCIYAVAVLHMLVEDAHREGFYAFFSNHLKDKGIGLICTMGDGETERCSDVSAAFTLQERIHEQTGKTVYIAGTFCCMVPFSVFEAELQRNDLQILEKGITAIEPDFSSMMYAVVRKR